MKIFFQPGTSRSIHEKLIGWSVHLIAPVVFYFGSKAHPWNLSCTDLLQYPAGSFGYELGSFYRKERIDPIPRAEYHDAFHVLCGYSTSLKDEVALQFFLHGNGKKSLASLGSVMSAWIVFPFQWNYFREAYRKGGRCADLSKLNLKHLLMENLQSLRATILKTNKI